MSGDVTLDELARRLGEPGLVLLRRLLARVVPQRTRISRADG